MITSFHSSSLKATGVSLMARQRYVGFIDDGTTHMQDLLADLLSDTETNADKGETNEPIDLNRVFEKVTQNLTRAIEESGAVGTSGALPTIHGQEARFVHFFRT